MLNDDKMKTALGDDADEVARIKTVAEEAAHGNASPEDLSKAIDDTKAEIAKLKAEGHTEEAEALEKVLAKLEETQEANQAKQDAADDAARMEAAKAAQEEEWKGCDASPAHLALYEAAVPKDEIRQVMLDLNFSPDTAEVVAQVSSIHHDKTASKLFQWHNSTLKHGEATRIRYDPKTCTAGYSQARYDKWWAGVDKNGDGTADLALQLPGTSTESIKTSNLIL